jgi:catechol 2,3-dioxygenase
LKAHFLGHVVFYVEDIDNSLKFYHELIGFNIVGSFKKPFSAVALSSGRTHHELLLIEVGSAPKSPTGHRLGLYHIGIKVGDSLEELTEVKRELTDLGISISGMSDHTVSQSIYILDPDGNEVELYVDDPNIDWKNEPNLVMSPIKPLFLRD